MNKTKKGLLTAGSIVTIVGCVFAIIGAIVFLFLGGIFNEEFIKETFESSPEYTYHEEIDGSYYFTEYVDGVQVITYEEDIELAAKIFNIVFKVTGTISLGFSIAKLILAICLLVKTCKNIYAKGCTITLLVLTALGFNWVEAVLFLIAICKKTELEEENNSSEGNTIDGIETISVQ